MLKIENTEVLGWEHAIRGMRNPMNSWAKSDSEVSVCECERWPHDVKKSFACLGSNDLDLMKRLRNAGTDHRKFMRMITVYLDITAPLYWWKEFDTYKVGTVANSCSTMHKIADKEFTLADFSCEHLDREPYHRNWIESVIVDEDITSPHKVWMTPFDVLRCTIEMLNAYRENYLETKDKQDWWQMIQLLPSSYNQRRTVMLNYEVLANIYKSRRNHKLDEWHTFCDWIEELPYSELITGPSLKDTPKSFSIKIPKEKVAPEVLNLIERVEREEQQRVKFGHHMSDGSLDPRFVIETEDDCDGKQ